MVLGRKNCPKSGLWNWSLWSSDQEKTARSKFLPRVPWKNPWEANPRVTNPWAARTPCSYISKVNFNILEKALQAFASSSWGAACPGATRGQPQGSIQGVRRWFLGDLSEKKFCDEQTNGRTDGRTDRRVSRNSSLDGHLLTTKSCYSL